jgi:hypothetical protein
LPVSIEGRNENSQAKYQQDKTSSRNFGIFGSHNKGEFRADSASSQESEIEKLEKNTNTFCIRAQR